MSLNLTTMNDALKTLYLPRTLSVIRTNTVLRSRLKTNTDSTSVSGKGAIVPVNIRPSEAIGARGDGEALPQPQNQRYQEVSISYAYNYATMRVTHPVMVASRTNEGAWIKAVGSEMKGLTRDLSYDLDRQDHGYGYGVLGTVNGPVSANTSITMDPGHQVKINMMIDAYTATSGGTHEADSVKVTEVSGNTVTVERNVTISDGSYIFREDSRGNESMGLMGLVDANSATTTYIATLQGIPRVTYPEWDSIVDDNSGTAREITDTLIDDVLFQVEETGEGNTTLGLTSRIQFRKIGHMLVSDRRFAFNTTLQGGFKAIEWADVPIVLDPRSPVDANGNDMLFLLDESVIQRYLLADMDWDDEDGNVLHRNQGYATYDATLFEYGNLGITDPGVCASIRDLDRS